MFLPIGVSAAENLPARHDVCCASLRSPRISLSYFRVALRSELSKMSISEALRLGMLRAEASTLAAREALAALRERQGEVEVEVRGRRARVVAAATEEPGEEASR